MLDIVFTLNPALVIQLILAVFLPIAVGFVTTQVTSSGKKAVLLAALTLVTSLLTQLGEAVAVSGVFDLGLALLAAIPAFAISVSTHYGLWKPTGVSEKVQDIGNVSA